ncbi:MAG: 50S ribosomal protein L10 [Erysipelotrichaceae bacterium]|nr:50S ribosomal protein L10 [Erysipelotrichaceae bacterium]
MNEAIINSKKAVVSEIAEKMKTAQSTVVVEYRGLSVTEMTQLRRDLSAEGVEFKVYKNSLAQRATEEAGVQDLAKDLVGPNAIAFGNDAVAPARVLANFAKTHEQLVLKSGIVEGKVVDSAMIKQLATLPNREGMISMLLSCLQSPVRGFACVVKAVKDQKEAQA